MSALRCCRLMLLLLLLVCAVRAQAADAQPAGAQCGVAFLAAAAAALRESQQPADCASARLLVLETDAEHFEGLGSVLMSVAEGLAEAHVARRALILGSPAAEPAVLRGAACSDGVGWACYFQPLGACSWRDVRSDEAAALPSATSSCGARVKSSTPTRGAPTLFSVPPELAPALPPGTSRAAAAECWAAAVFVAAVRLQPALEARLAALRAALFGDGAYAAAHLRHGDNAMEAAEYGGRVYTNKPLVNASALGAALRDSGLPIYLATDAVDAQAAADALSATAGGARVTLLPRFRSAHGSHTAAFATTMLTTRALLPEEAWGAYLSPGGRYASADAGAVAAADQDAVREEALADLYLLSGAAALAGSAASHYSVAAWLWSLARGAATQPATWVDAADVARGTLSTGFMHGQLNSTFALQHPEQRALVATRRWLDWPLDAESDELIAFHPQRCTPLVPAAAMRRLRAAWSCAEGGPPADDFVRRCVERVEAGRRPLEGQCTSAVDLVNAGVDFWEGFNVEMAAAAWQAAVQLRGGGNDEVLSVALENHAAMTHKRRGVLARYLRR